MEKELLQQALNSILHGSTQIISSTDHNGNITLQEIKVNDLRVLLIDKLAQKFINTQEFKEALMRAINSDLIKKLQEIMIAGANYKDLPYTIKQKMEREMQETKLEIRKYTLVAEVIKDKINE